MCVAQTIWSLDEPMFAKLQMLQENQDLNNCSIGNIIKQHGNLSNSVCNKNT